MASKVLRFLIFGPPGSGKGTISERIVRDFRLRHVSSGDLLRRHVKDKTEYGRRVADTLAKGGLVSDDLMVELVLADLAAIPPTENWLLDGFPRTKGQAEKLDAVHDIDSVINLNVPFQVIVDRLACRWIHPASGRIYNLEFNPPKQAGLDDVTKEPLIQREDDKPETVVNRLNVYQNMTQPLIDHYTSKNKLIEFRGSFSNEIWPHVHRFLATKLKPIQYTEYH